MAIIILVIVPMIFLIFFFPRVFHIDVGGEDRPQTVQHSMLWRFRKVLARPGIRSNIEMELIPVQQHRNGIYEIVRLILILNSEFNILSLNIFPEIGVARGRFHGTQPASSRASQPAHRTQPDAHGTQPAAHRTQLGPGEIR